MFVLYYASSLFQIEDGAGKMLGWIVQFLNDGLGVMYYIQASIAAVLVVATGFFLIRIIAN